MAAETKFKETEIGMIPEDWDFIIFKEILTDGTKNGIYKQKEFHGHGSKIVNMGELFAYPRLYSVPMKRVNLTDNEIKRFSLKENDLLFARRSLVAEGAGKCSIVREINEPTVFESSIIRAKPNPKKANSLYLYYLFNSKYGLYLLDTIRRQVAVAGITGNDLQNLQIPLPPLTEQEVIANIISSLDDKIELNLQMNSTLEQIAQSLFKRWFLDFEFPDENGNPYKSSGGRMVDSELGEIPEGWEVISIGELIERDILEKNQDGNHGEKHPKLEDFVDRGIPFITAADLENNLLDLDNCKHITDEKVKSLRVGFAKEDDVLLTHKATMGRVVIVPLLDGYIVLSPQVTYFRIKDKNLISKEFLYYNFTSNYFQKILSSYSEQSTRNYLSILNQRKIEMIYPPYNLTFEFTEKVQNITQLKHLCQSENRNLKKVRDSLLPKLMSGKIRVQV